VDANEVAQAGDEAWVVDPDGFDALLRALGEQRRLLGPMRRDGVIGIGEIAGIDDLPHGWTDDQAPGRYRTVPRADDACFGYAVGDRSWRREVDPPRTTLVRIRRRGDDVPTVEAPDPGDGIEPTAWVGVRGCDLAALAITDRVFLGGDHADAHYGARRAAPFIVAVECGSPAATCFCSSMGTGPGIAADRGADLVVTEVGAAEDQPGPHRFVIRVGTERGQALLADLDLRVEASADDRRAAVDVVARATATMGRTIDVDEVRGRIAAGLDGPHWDEVAQRCLSCANCTLVCPTCFCSTVEDTTDLTGEVATRTRVWDSCFTLGHSYLHGGSVRATTADRYRQWLTHKLDTWWDQFGTSGCVGCGRCTTWCPAGIDLLEEVPA
jgi:formate hydrogenlyase subunit 6/NADH:ubiquinone oxidoreductase subunit I